MSKTIYWLTGVGLLTISASLAGAGLTSYPVLFAAVAALQGWLLGLHFAADGRLRHDRIVAERHLLQSLEELNSTCHCGRPAEVNEILGYSRGMCADCDEWRCDAYPAGCGHLNPIEQAHVDKRRKENGS